MIYEPRVITGPTMEPVSLEELKVHCNVDTDDADWTEKLIQFGTAARMYYEWRTGRTLHQQTLEWVIDNWPAADRICLPRSTPLVSITSLKYYDQDGTEATWASSNYIADTWSEPGALVLTYGNSWPSLTLYPVAPIRIRYVAGTATASPITEVDEDVKIPILMIAGALWNMRESEIVTEMRAIQSIQPKAAEFFIQRRLVEYVV